MFKNAKGTYAWIRIQWFSSLNLLFPPFSLISKTDCISYCIPLRLDLMFDGLWSWMHPTKSKSLQNYYVVFEKKNELTYKIKPETSDVSHSKMLILSIQITLELDDLQWSTASSTAKELWNSGKYANKSNGRWTLNALPSLSISNW